MKVRLIPTACLLSLLLAPLLVCHALDEDGIIERLNQASACLAQRQWDEAASAYEEVLKSDPNNAYALFGMARLYMGQQRWQKAIGLLEQAQKHLPTAEEASVVNDWHIIGPFPNPGEGEGLSISYPPEKEIKLDAVYEGKPGDPAAAKAAMAKVAESCMTCHEMCRGKETEAAPKTMIQGKCMLVLPKTPADIPQFAAGLSDMMSIMMAMQMACDMGAKAAEYGATDAAAFAAAIMKAVQSHANAKFAANEKFAAGGKKLCEAAAEVEAADKVATKVQWQKKNGEEVFSLDKSMPLGNVVVYGFANLESDKDEVVELRVGSDDGCKVWLNGRPLWTNPTSRAVNPDQDRIIVRLRKGANQLLMKVEQRGGQYGMAAKIVRGMSVGGPLQNAKQQYDKVKTQALVRMSARGLKPESQKGFWICKKGRCVKTGVAGRMELMPPGRYEIRVGFDSGYLEQEYDLKAGEEFTVPTGLFTFRQVTPPDLVCTVPQKLYHLETETYLITGYQGVTTRLYPGKYRVCYQDMNDEQPSLVFEPWYVAGVFPAPDPNKGLNEVYPPEKELIPDVGKTYEFGGQTIRWQKIEDYPEVDMVKILPTFGVAYAAATIESPEAREVELVMTFKGGMKVWLNGALIKTTPPVRQAYAVQRIAMFAPLKKGQNTLLVKTHRASYDWPLSAVAVGWKMYDVDIAAEKD